MIVYTKSFGPLETNAILLGCSHTKKGAIIDPSQGSAGPLLQKAASLGLSIEKIILTHSHWDHFVDAHFLKLATKAPLYVHELDAKNVEHPGSDGLPLFIPIHPVTPDHLLKEGDVIEVGELRLEVIHTPGHSPGGVCFYLRKEKLLISGDTLFEGTIGRLNLPTGQPDQMWQSLRKLVLLPTETRVIPGHGGETTIGREHWLAQAEQIFSE
jgi:glyoxylase-like metal-dependent hydrolase (beta-lactamase superfamily II)